MVDRRILTLYLAITIGFVVTRTAILAWAAMLLLGAFGYAVSFWATLAAWMLTLFIAFLMPTISYRKGQVHDG